MFVKGVSGNPKGRPKVHLAAAEMAREQIKRHRLFDKLGKAAARLNDTKLSTEERSLALRAAATLIEHGFGKPAQRIDVQKEDIQIRVIYETYRLEIAGAAPSATDSAQRNEDSALPGAAGGQEIRQIDAGQARSDSRDAGGQAGVLDRKPV